ncbi:MAG: hypothetical protein L0177_18620, partial [Chloroflexi bacterium]|nr:hypothetical protein [Chloroflexota bacterium]
MHELVGQGADNRLSTGQAGADEDFEDPIGARFLGPTLADPALLRRYSAGAGPAARETQVRGRGSPSNGF